MNATMNTSRRTLALCTAALLGLGLAFAAPPAHAQIKSGDNPEASEIWQKVRASLFQSRPITAVTDDTLVLDVPVRAEDAAIVPVSIRTRLPQTAARHVEKLYLVIDNNPSPISAIFAFTPLSGRVDIETRVRVDEYTFMRAIAEMNDGSLVMTTRWVKASGGCSAPPGKDQAAALASLGKMKIRVEGDITLRQPVLAQLMISHPNNSGMVMDQATRQFTPAHYVRQINVTYGGQPVMSADLDFSISENPNLRFYFMPDGKSRLSAEVLDSRNQSFKSSLDLGAAN
jgi:sulfur-oxidizing protein SoxY